MHSDDPTRDRPCARHLNEVVEVCLKRRQLLKAGLGVAALSFFGVPSALKPTAAYAAGPGFASLPFPVGPFVSGDANDVVRVATGYTAKALVAWGDPILSGGVAWDGTPDLNDDQTKQFGAHCDGMHFFPFVERAAGGGTALSNTRGVLAVNNEYVDQAKLFTDGLANWNDPVIGPKKVKKSLAAHGVSIVEVRKDSAGNWALASTSPFNRRITGETLCDISGPAAGHPLLKTPSDATGKLAAGTLNNCANGYTPWGTYLTCEENFNGYFGSTTAGVANAFTANQLEGDYGLNAPGFGYRWSENETRFELNGNQLDATSPDPALNRNNEPNRFGWVVEIDPFNPAKKPVKRTALGRIKHEGAVYALATDGRVVIYMGDDQAGEYIYKFVTTGKYNPNSRTANLNLLDSGTLYVARFDAGNTPGDNMGTGVWLPLDLSNPAISAFFGANLGAMLVNARRAADLAGATPMDRPEWIAVNPAGSSYDPASGADAPFKEVYCSLTNNSGRTVVDEANPRAPNPYGHIIRWQEAGGDAAATTFAWDIFVLAGDPVRNAGTVQAGNINGDTFGSPDGLWFDSNLRLWIQTDISSGSLGITNYANMPVNMMLCADPVTKEVRRFLTGPYRCEVTGVVNTPDNKTMFVGIQHPGESSGDTGDPTQPEQFSKFPASQGHGAFGCPRSTVMVITKDDGGVIGT